MPHCGRRSRLYARELKGTADYLRGLLAPAGAARAGDDSEEPFSRADAERLAPALADEALVNALEDILATYAVYGVARDLRRLKKSKVLFLKDTSAIPALDEVLPLGSAPPTYIGAGKTVDPDVTSSMAYYRYFRWYIDPKSIRQNGAHKSGVEAFYERYPLLAHAVRTITANYQANIKLACQRVARDWNAIKAAFFPGRAIERLVKIQTTGNDFHKGGKQVLILTFGCSTGPPGRVVYKPSAVEIDCRIVGDSVTAEAVLAPEGYRQRVSLTELINQYNKPRPRPGGFTSRPLPTYKILPYNCGSVPDAYGYIEFLTHEPRLKEHAAQGQTADVGAAVARLDPADVTRSDWIAGDPREGQVFYHALGGVMAMAMAVSICDLHVQNVIAHDRLPHLIDLEEALKMPMTRATETFLPSVLDRLDDPGSPVLRITKDRTSDLDVEWPSSVGPAASILYLRDPGGQPAVPLLARDEPNRRALIHGFIDAIEALTTQACHEEVKAWVRGLDGTIARFVTLATVKYAWIARELYKVYAENSPQLLLDHRSGHDAFKAKDETTGRDVFFFALQVRATRASWNDTQKQADPGKAAWDLPLFAVEHPDHAWRDYLNCDVPSFYHRLGRPDLLDTKGDVVNVARVVKWQNANISQHGDLQEFCGRPLPGGALEKTAEINDYFPEVPTKMLLAQLDDMMANCATKEGKEAFLKTALEGVGGMGHNVRQFLRSRDWVSGRSKPGGPGA